MAPTLFVLFFFALKTGGVEYFDKHNAQFIEISRRYSKYLSSQNTASNHKPLINLANFVDNFESCLAHIINYDGVDLPSTKAPLVLSRYDVVKVLYLVTSTVVQTSKPVFSKRYRVFSYNDISKNKSHLEWCKRNRLDMECNDIPFVDKSGLSKGWKCEVHFYLSPPNDPNFIESAKRTGKPRLRIPGNFKRLFWALNLTSIEIRDGYTEDVLLVTRPRFDILMAEENTKTLTCWKNTLSEYALTWYDIVAHTNKELIVAKLWSKNAHQSILVQKVLQIHSLVLLCRSCNISQSLQPIHLELFANYSSLISKIHSINEINKDMVLYKIWPLGEALVKGFVSENYKLPNTRNRVKLNKLIQDKTRILSDLRWEIEIRMLGNVLNNASFRLFPFGCEDDYPFACNDFYQPFIYIVPSGNIEHTHFQLHRKALTFVSCGIKVHTGLAFDQLVSIFDIYVWIYLLVSVFSISAFCALVQMYKQMPEMKSRLGVHDSRCDFKRLSLIQKISHYVQDYLSPSLMSYFKVLIEQGDPINVKLWNIPFLGYTFACFLFAAVVISNGYKNENITKLTLPLDSIAYDTFPVITQNNFSIYTRAIMIGGFYEIRAMMWPIFENLYELWATMGLITPNRTGHHMSTIFRSEVYSFAHSQVSLRRFFLNSDNFSDPAKQLLKHTNIIPNWYRIFHDSFGRCSLFDEKNDNPCDPLQFCNNTALMLPDLEAHTKYYLLKRSGMNAFIGHEPLIEYKFGIIFARWVHPVVIQRMKGFYASGAMEWWDGFIINFLTRLRVGFYDETEDQVTAANLNGNIAVVFVVLATGVVVSLLVFLVEKIRNSVLYTTVLNFFSVKLYFRFCKFPYPWELIC